MILLGASLQVTVVLFHGTTRNGVSCGFTHELQSEALIAVNPLSHTAVIVRLPRMYHGRHRVALHHEIHQPSAKPRAQPQRTDESSVVEMEDEQPSVVLRPVARGLRHPHHNLRQSVASHVAAVKPVDLMAQSPHISSRVANQVADPEQTVRLLLQPQRPHRAVMTVPERGVVHSRQTKTNAAVMFSLATAMFTGAAVIFSLATAMFTVAAVMFSLATARAAASAANRRNQHHTDESEYSLHTPNIFCAKDRQKKNQEQRIAINYYSTHIFRPRYAQGMQNSRTCFGLGASRSVLR